MRGLSSVVKSIGVLAGLAVASGCGVNFYAGRPGDVKRIHELAAQIEQLRQQKEAENQQLREAKALLEERLRKEIGSQQVRLEMEERGLVLTFVAEVLFDSGKAKVRPEANETLSKVAGVIQEKVSDRKIGIEGHTDNEPIKHSGWKSNWELSTARATSVLHFLEEQGVNPRLMVASGYGEHNPVIANDSLEGRRKNRRVEIVILPKQLTKGEKALLKQAASSDELGVAEKASALEAYK